MNRRMRLVLSILCLTACLVPPVAEAAPVWGYGGTNVTRFAQGSWTLTKENGRSIDWVLTAIETREAQTHGEPGPKSNTSLFFYKVDCRPDICYIKGRAWKLDSSSFEFDPLMEGVRVSIPGKVDLAWKATGDPGVGAGHVVRPRPYTDPDDYVGAESELEAVGAVGRMARLTGRVDSYPGRIKVNDAVIYTWTGTALYSDVCVIDEGALCL